MPLIQRKQNTCKLEMSQTNTAITSFAGLSILRDTLQEFGLINKMKEFMLKQAGYADDIILEAIILLMAAGGQCLSDWEYLKNELGFQKIFGQCPSVDVIEEYLKRLPMTQIPYENESGQIGYSTLLESLHEQMLKIAYELAGSPDKLTADLDASLFKSDKKAALFCYDKFKAYQPFVAYCPELRMLLKHEFRDGNVSPSLGYQRVLRRCKKLFPHVKWTVRADSAGYILEWLDEMNREQMLYYVTVEERAGLTEILKAEPHWEPYIDRYGVTTTQETAEIDYCPTFSAQQELADRRNMRFIGIRKLKSQQTDLLDDNDYVHQVIVTNDPNLNRNEIVQTHWGRCGSVEFAYSELKNGCGVKKFPSGKFEVNAAWFSLGLLTHNILRVMQEHILPEPHKRCEIKTLRFRIIRAAAWVKEQGRQVVLRFCKGHYFYELYEKARERLKACVLKLQAA